MKPTCSDPNCGFQDDPMYHGIRLEECNDHDDVVWYAGRNCPACDVVESRNDEVDELTIERDQYRSGFFQVERERDEAQDRAQMYEDEIDELKGRGCCGDHERTIIEDGM